MIDSLGHTTSDESIWELASKKIWIGLEFWVALLTTNIYRSIWNIEWRNKIDRSRPWCKFHQSSLPKGRIHHFSYPYVERVNRTESCNANNCIFWKINFFIYIFSLDHPINILSMTSKIESLSSSHRKNLGNIKDTSLSGLYVETGSFFRHHSTGKIGINWKWVYEKRIESK